MWLGFFGKFHFMLSRPEEVWEYALVVVNSIFSVLRGCENVTSRCIPSCKQLTQDSENVKMEEFIDLITI